MPSEIGIADDYLDLLVNLKRFLTTGVAYTEAAADSGNTGNGDISSVVTADTAPSELWTITATSSTNFTVTGSISGAQAAATVDASGGYSNGMISFSINSGSIAFVSSDEFTITTTVGMGESAYAVEEWNTDHDGDGNYQLILNGPGSSVGQDVYTGIQTNHNDVDDWFNWFITGLSGYSNGVTFYNQIGNISQSGMAGLPQLPLHNTTIPYWFRATGRSYVVVAKVSTVYETMYNGWLLPYGNPLQYPYPSVCCGSLRDNDNEPWRWSSTAHNHRGFPDPFALRSDDPDYNTKACGYFLDGQSWRPFGNRYDDETPTQLSFGRNTWPYFPDYSGSGSFEYSRYTKPWTDMMIGLDGVTNPLFPIHLITYRDGNNTYGVFEGCFAIPGQGLSAEDTVVVDGVTYVVFPVNYHSENHEYWCMRMD